MGYSRLIVHNSMLSSERLYLLGVGVDFIIMFVDNRAYSGGALCLATFDSFFTHDFMPTSK